jgi:hypothetical protein
MPTWGPTDVGAAAATTSSGLGAGQGPHLPVGTWSGTRYRSGVRLQPPSGWSAWTSISSATLKVKTTTFSHVGPRNSTIYVKRMTTASGGQWEEASGTQNCNSGFSGSNATQYSDLDPVAANAVTFQSGTAENSWKSIDVTALVRDYWNARATVSNLSFILDQLDSSDYAEFYTDDSAGNEPTLTIVYVDAAPPSAPTLLSPAASASVKALRPTFTWNHNDPQSNAQVAAEVRVWDAAGTTQVGTTQTVSGAAETLTWPTDLVAKTTYQFDVRTSDATGWGPFAAKRVFKVQGGPTVTFTPPKTEWSSVARAPRIRLNFATASDDAVQDTPTNSYQIESPPGTVIVPWTTVSSTVFSVLLDGFAIADNTSYTFRVRAKTVGVTYAEGFADQTVKPRFGVTVHRRDLLSVPTGWQSALVQNTIPAGSDLKVQYGSNTSAAAAPTAWFDDIGGVPLAQWVYWRAWFLPSATAGPTLDKVTIIATTSPAQGLDKWFTSRAGAPLVAPWAVDSSEYVYGTRSARCTLTGAGPFFLYSLPILLRANRSYILTGLMKSAGNSGAQIMLQNETGAVLTSPDGEKIQTEPPLTDDTLFYTPDRLDVFRYKTPVYVAPGTDVTVWVVLQAGGTNGARAWFDAIKLEESTVATAWSPGAIGAAIVDAGGVQIDGSKGGVFRYKGTDGGVRSVVGGGVSGLLFAGDTELSSPADGVLAIDGVPIPLVVPPTWEVQAGTFNVVFSASAVSDIPTVTFPHAFAVGTLPVVVLSAGANAAGPNINVGLRTGPTRVDFQPQAREVREVAQTMTLLCQYIAFGPKP